MLNDVKLDKIALDNQEYMIQLLDMINKDEKLKKTFSGGRNTLGRILNSNYVAFIKDLDKTVGFIMITTNEKTGIKEVDMGILTDYRKSGYGTKALGLLKEIIIKEKVKVEVQIENVNIAAIQTVLKNGFTLLRRDEIYSYYTVEFETGYTR